ncbi:hybrid sensor histidine kinase/response regulator [Legionella dresdenensis]|uniref:histidine kinase n=1 Tax=Legionella dresdenensis TaxID=450200 RepID=A0ABV8CDL9_9GAMM
MSQNIVTSWLLSILEVNDLDSYKKIINRLITFLIVFGLCLNACAMFLSYHQYEKKSENDNKKLIINANSILQSNISEKLSIVVNNQDFVSYINEGEYSRKLNAVSMMLLFNNFIDNNLITGIKVYKKGNDPILSVGDTNSAFYVKLNLCYLSGQINNQFGNCYASIMVLMSKNHYLNQLSRINANIKACKKQYYKCEKVDPFGSTKFGSFYISDSEKKFISIEHISPSIYPLLIPAIIILLISSFGLLITQKLVKTLTNIYLANPIKEIETNLKNNIPLRRKYIKEINYLAKEIEEYQEHKFEIELGKSLAQVAHDIRSPLLAIDSLFHLVEKKLNESERILGRRAIRRLNDIAWSLLSKYKNKNETVHADENNYVFLYSCIQEILSEKRMEYVKHNIEFELHVAQKNVFLLVYLSSVNLKRMLSNIINNAVNSILPKSGVVEISLEINSIGVLIAIKDNGRGMTPDFVKGIFDNAECEKVKTNLGLPHAINFVKQAGGLLDIISSAGNGTTVNISFPLCITPPWSISEYQVQVDDLLIFIDDSKSVHDVWDEKLRDLQYTDYKHFYNAEDALSFLKKINNRKIVIFCDYEFFNEDKNGLHILENAPFDATKILVTGCLYNQKIMESTIEKGFKILPKDLVPYFKYSLSGTNSQFEI